MRKKFLQGVTSLGIAAAICLACGAVTASAATLNTLNPEKVTVDYESQKIVVDFNEATTQEDDNGSGDDDQGGGDQAAATEKEIMFGVSALKKGAVTTSAWEVYDVKDGKVVIDISSLNTQKDNYMQIKGDASSDPLTLLIPKTDKTLKLQFNAVKADVTVKKGDDKAALEYRTQYGDWAEYKAGVDLSVYQQRGATLYFRLSTTKSQTVKAGKLESDVYTMASLPGKEIKVAVGKKANGPKATADFVKQSVVIPAGTVYRVIDPAEDELPAGWTKNESKLTLAGNKIPDALYTGGSLEVKKAATETKPESKIFQLAFPNPKATVTSAAGTGDTLATVTDGDKTVTFKMTKTTGKKPKDVLEITNGTASQYQVYVGTTVPENGKGVKAVKAGKTLKITSPADKASIWVRKVGDKKNAIWSTDYTDVAKVVIPSAPSGDDDNKGPTADEIKAMLQSVASEFIAANVTMDRGTWAAGAPIVITNSGKEIKWGESAEYTLADASKVSGVTVTAAITSQSDADNHFSIADNVLTATSKPCNDDTVNVKVTLTKDGQSYDTDVVVTVKTL